MPHPLLKFINRISGKDEKYALGKLAGGRFSYVRVHSLIAHLITENLVLTG